MPKRDKPECDPVELRHIASFFEASAPRWDAVLRACADALDTCRSAIEGLSPEDARQAANYAQGCGSPGAYRYVLALRVYAEKLEGENA